MGRLSGTRRGQGPDIHRTAMATIIGIKPLGRRVRNVDEPPAGPFPVRERRSRVRKRRMRRSARKGPAAGPSPDPPEEPSEWTWPGYSTKTATAGSSKLASVMAAAAVALASPDGWRTEGSRLVRRVRPAPARDRSKGGEAITTTECPRPIGRCVRPGLRNHGPTTRDWSPASPVSAAARSNRRKDRARLCERCRMELVKRARPPLSDRVYILLGAKRDEIGLLTNALQAAASDCSCACSDLIASV